MHGRAGGCGDLATGTRRRAVLAPAHQPASWLAALMQPWASAACHCQLLLTPLHAPPTPHAITLHPPPTYDVALRQELGADLRQPAKQQDAERAGDPAWHSTSWHDTARHSTAWSDT